jgi:hypothetical protein
MSQTGVFLIDGRTRDVFAKIRVCFYLIKQIHQVWRKGHTLRDLGLHALGRECPDTFFKVKFTPFHHSDFPRARGRQDQHFQHAFGLRLQAINSHHAQNRWNITPLSGRLVLNPFAFARLFRQKLANDANRPCNDETVSCTPVHDDITHLYDTRRCFRFLQPDGLQHRSYQRFLILFHIKQVFMAKHLEINLGLVSGLVVVARL